jgi:hypothetical protein
MKPKSTQMEVLILTGTSFSAKQLSEKNDSTPKSGRSEKDMLSEACWNGMLPSLLPELCEQLPAGKRVWLWQIKEGDAFIELELGETQEEKESHFSIDPYVFIADSCLS